MPTQSDMVFAAYCMHHEKSVAKGFEINRDAFNSIVEGCDVKSTGQTPERWAIDNVPVRNTLKEVK